MKVYQDQYDKTYDQFQTGKITADEWYQFCYNVLDEIIQENKDVMIRLKNR
jgi:hypothetical protein